MEPSERARAHRGVTAWARARGRNGEEDGGRKAESSRVPSWSARVPLYRPEEAGREREHEEMGEFCPTRSTCWQTATPRNSDVHLLELARSSSIAPLGLWHEEGMRLPFLFAFSVTAVSAVLAACSTSSTSSGGGDPDGGGVLPDGGTTTDASSDGGSGGNPLIPAGVTKIVFTSKGGFLAPGPDGSTCTAVDITYTLTLPDRGFTWTICESIDGGPNGFRDGSRFLTVEEYAKVDEAIQALKRQTMVQCGADKPEEKITFTSPSGEVTYLDDFYFCDANDTKIYVTGMENVFSVMTMQVR